MVTSDKIFYADQIDYLFGFEALYEKREKWNGIRSCSRLCNVRNCIIFSCYPKHLISEIVNINYGWLVLKEYNYRCIYSFANSDIMKIICNAYY